jgi:hypothetical protein
MAVSLHIAMAEVIHAFDRTFSEFKASGYKIPENTDKLRNGIEWYNSNIMLVSLAHTCPMNYIYDITPEMYMWAYSSGLVATAHMQIRMMSTQ